MPKQNIENRRNILKALKARQNAAIQEENDVRTVKTNIKDTNQSLSITISEEEIIIMCRAQGITLYDFEAQALLEELKILYGVS